MVYRLLVAALVAALFLTACQRQETPSPPEVSDRPAPGTVRAAVTGALSVADPLARAATLSAVLQGLGPDAVGEVVDAYEGISWSARDSLGVELALLVEWWGRHDPAGAYEWLRAHHWLQNPVLERAAIRAWATRDPEAARTHVASSAGRDKDLLIAALVEGWLASGQEGIEAYVATLPPGPTRQVALSSLARRRILRDGIDATLGWAEAVPEDAPGRLKLQTQRRVASAVAEVDPQRAAAWVERQLDGDYWDGLPRRVAVIWARQDGEASLAWLRTLPPEKLGSAIEEAYRAWLRYDRERARAWIHGVESDPFFEPAVALYSLTVARDDPPAALPWAAKVEHAPLRHRTLVRIGQAWMARDPEAAAAWLAESELTPKERDEVANRTPRRRKPAPATSGGAAPEPEATAH